MFFEVEKGNMENNFNLIFIYFTVDFTRLCYNNWPHGGNVMLPEFQKEVSRIPHKETDPPIRP